MKKNLLITGASGFIGSSFVRLAIKEGYNVVALDLLTYSGLQQNLADPIADSNCLLVKGNICDSELVFSLFSKFNFEAIVNFAAESHVDNSIQSPEVFVSTNIVGTFKLLEVARRYLDSGRANTLFKFLHVSTDEVYGQLGATGKFSEFSSYAPSSPYSASKAASDHLVRAWFSTYGLPAVITNCSNNYGPRQFPEKLIPLMFTHALLEKPLPVYGNGGNVRDWIHVEDHCEGLMLALKFGKMGESYCFGGDAERTNLQVVTSICSTLDNLRPRKNGQSYSELITFVKDRPGHDYRYAIDDTKAKSTLGFKRKYTSFEDGLRQTITWYLDNETWVATASQAIKVRPGVIK